MNWGRFCLVVFVVLLMSSHGAVAQPSTDRSDLETTEVDEADAARVDEADSDSERDRRSRRARLQNSRGSFSVVGVPPADLPSLQGLQPTLAKTFLPDRIGPGSATTLQFVVDNPDGLPVTQLAFTDTLPAGVTISSVPAVTQNCDATIAAPAGGSTITVSDGEAPGSGSCTITVDVTSSTLGTHVNVTSPLTWENGTSNTATDDLIVVNDRPGFTKSFAPSAVALGGRSTLTFTVDNTANDGTVTVLSFTDTLPPGMLIADPSRAFTDCEQPLIPATLIADPGTSLISLGANGTAMFPVLGAGESCNVTVDVVATSVGVLGNVSGDLDAVVSGQQRSSGRAAAPLEVTGGALSLIKRFLADPVPAGGQVVLEFTITNFDRLNAATDIAFTDDLDATLMGMSAVGLPAADGCGAGSVLGGTTEISLTGGNLPAESSCTFSVTLDVPSTAVSGGYPNVSSSVTGQVGGAGVVGSPATDTLFVEPVPLLTKSYTDDPVGAGGTVTLEFTIQNQSSTSSATEMTFTDEFPDFMPTAVVPADGFCGAGSSALYVDTFDDPPLLLVQGASLASGASCTFPVVLDVAAGAPAGDYPNVTSSIMAIVDGETVTGGPATDTLTVVGAPMLIKEFTDDPVLPGDTVTLEFTIEHDEFAGGDATDIAFMDDLDAVISGLVATGLPLADVCGTGSMLSGTSTLSLTGGTLMPGEICTFSASLTVPATAPAGAQTNTTGNLTATVLGIATTGNTATDDLVIGGLVLTKEFTDDPALPGGTVTLEFTIQNTSPAEGATDIAFSDDLDDTLADLTVDPGSVPADPCGAGSSVILSSGDTFVTFLGGALAAGEMCVFSLTLDVPVAAASDSYPNTTEAFRATFGGGTVFFENASDELIVDSDLIDLEKSFTDDPVAPGDTATLQFTITNLDLANAATAIAFTDDLNAALSGLAAVGLPLNNVCGAGSQISGTTNLSFTGGSLAAGASCVFSVTVVVPGSTPGGTVATNVTSSATGSIGGLPVFGDPATDTLRVDAVTFSKSFDGPTTASGTAVLTFTLVNQGSTSLGDLSFTDNLDNVVSGLVATGLPVSNVCGTGSSIGGTSLLSFSGGELGPNGSCSFMVTVQVPIGAPAGTFLNTTSDLLQLGLPLGSPATADLTIEPPPTFAKIFAPDTIEAGAVSTLTFTIDNSASALAATSLDFTDNLPAGVVVATPANSSTDCSGGTVTAVGGSGVITYTGGTIAAGASCTVQADVTSVVAASHVNVTGDLTSSSGNSGTATDTLTVNALADLQLTLIAVYDPAVAHTVQVYDLIITNNGPGMATNAVVDQELPAGTYFLGAEPSSVSCTQSGVLVSCDLGDLAPSDSVAFSIGAFIDSRFDGALATDALVSSDTGDPDLGNNEVDVLTDVARPRSMLATERADGTEILVMVAKEADETVGLVFAEAAGGGNREYSVTGGGFRTVALVEVPNFSDSAAPEVAALASGFDGSVLVQVVDADSTNLIGSYPVPGSWVPIDLEVLEGFDPGGMTGGELAGGFAPTLALLLAGASDDAVHLVYVDTLTGIVLRDDVVQSDAFPISLSKIESVVGSMVEELVILTQDPASEATTVRIWEPEGAFASVTKTLTAGAFPIAVEGLEDLGTGPVGGLGGGPDVAALQREVVTGAATAELFDAVSGVDLTAVAFSAPLLADVFTRIDSFGGGSASELTAGGRSGMGLVVESRDAASGMIAGSIVIGGSLLPLDLAFHPSFAGTMDPDLAVLFEMLNSPTEVSVFDAAGGTPLFNFILP